MMNSMRNFSSGIISKILMLLLVVSFAMWGVGDMIRGGGVNYAAKVGAERISIATFQRQRAQVARQIQALGMGDVDASALDASILRQLVQQELIVLALHDLHFYVNDVLLGQVLKQEPAFLNPDGSFSAQRFRSILQSQQLSEAEALEQLKAERASRFLVASMDMRDVVPPLAVRNLAATTAQEMRDAWVVTIAPVAAPHTIDSNALQAFYESNKAILYMAPETRVLDYVTVKPKQIEALIDQNITDEMLEAAAVQQPKASKAELRTRLRGEQRERTLHDLQGVIDDALAAGMKLEEALKKAGISAPMHTLKATEALAKTSTDDVIQTVAEQGFMLTEGETSGLMITPKGAPVILYVSAVQPAAAQPYETVKNDVTTRVREQQRREATRARMQEVREALGKLVAENKQDLRGTQWQSVLKRFHLTAKRVNHLSRPSDEAKPTGKEVIPTSLRQAIFEHEPGNIAGPLTLENGGQMIAIVTEIHRPSAAQLTLDQKLTDTLSEQLNQTVQMRAFARFARQHPVVINPQLLSADGAPTEATP